MRVNSYNKFFTEVAKIMNTEVKSVKPIDGRYKVELANHVCLNVYRGVSGSLFIHDHRGVAHITSCYDFDDFKTMKDLYERLITDYSESTNAETNKTENCESTNNDIKGHIYIDTDSLKVAPLPEQQTSEESITDTIIADDNSSYNIEVLRAKQVLNTKYGNSFRKHLHAIINPEWHHVSLATLANIDNDMLDEKRRHYMKVYRMTANVINSIYKCSKLTTIDKLRTSLIQTVRTMAKNEKIEWALVQYVKAKIDNCYLVNGLQSSFYSKTYGYNKSRSYTKTFYI
jgi:hypothetical protein